MTSLGYIGAGGNVRRLPYDAEVEYLESTGTQWIDTGVLANGEFDFDYMFRRNTLQGNTVCMGARSASQFLTALQINGSGHFVFAYLGTVWSEGNWGVTNENEDYRVRLSFHSGSQSAIVNDVVLFADNKVGAELLNLPIYIFKRSNSGTETTYGLTGRFYFCKIWQNGALIRDFVPVRFTNELGQSEGAMYDRANPTVGMNPDGSARTDGLYRNRGTGAFLYGPDI